MTDKIINYFERQRVKDIQKKRIIVEDIKEFDNLEIGTEVIFRDRYAEGIYAGKVAIDVGSIVNAKITNFPLLLTSQSPEYRIHGTYLKLGDKYIIPRGYTIEKDSCPKKFSIYEAILQSKKK